MALAAAILLLMLPLQPTLATINDPSQETNLNNIDLPTALDEDIFGDLPFEQRRQVLREEVQSGDHKPSPSQSPQRYNFLIR